VKIVLEMHIISVVHALLWTIEYFIIIMNALALINITLMAYILSVYNAIIHGNN